MWSPSLTVLVFVIAVGVPLFKLASVPLARTNLRVLDVLNSPWTLFKIILFTSVIELTKNLRFLPVSPTLAPKTSPVLYPWPVVVTETLPTVGVPPDITIVATPPVPLPVIVVKGILE